jgi:hypothetical protein
VPGWCVADLDRQVRPPGTLVPTQRNNCSTSRRPRPWLRSAAAVAMSHKPTWPRSTTARPTLTTSPLRRSAAKPRRDPIVPRIAVIVGTCAGSTPLKRQNSSSHASLTADAIDTAASTSLWSWSRSTVWTLVSPSRT